MVFNADETVDDVGKIEPDKESVREDSYSLPNGFEWDTLDLGNSTQVSFEMNIYENFCL